MLQMYVLNTDLDKDPRVLRSCGKHIEVYFKKHCAAALYLPETDWMLVLDADTGSMLEEELGISRVKRHNIVAGQDKMIHVLIIEFA
ncbi:hypothetical protein ANCDUO_10436 [Ancylostoma duodenale]|uniref:Uncharacterized protein n=1 Tax=Ancylostoma duodenale TaxID=51022 RepID=A0A0C2CRA2_9BILA|nr:hypothetical protein ANCDUO_10436 [Ancylostoma duodenale]